MKGNESEALPLLVWLSSVEAQLQTDDAFWSFFLFRLVV